MNIKNILIYLLSIVFYIPFLNAQVHDTVGNHKDFIYAELPDDPYIPNEYQNKKLSPAYSFRNSGLRNSNGTLIITSQVNVNKDGFNILGDAANEPSIAFDQTDRNHIVIGWRQFDNVNSNFRQAGWAYSFDAGKSWTFPGVIEPQIFRSDPVLDSDIKGNFYYNSLSNDFRCKVFKSDNYGIYWDNGVNIGGGDKQWMTIDKLSENGQGNIYSSWVPHYSICPPGFFTRSTDNGKSFEDCTELPDDPEWGTLAVSKEGILYQSGNSSIYGQIVVIKSLNARYSGVPIIWETPVYVNIGGEMTGWSPINPEGLVGQLNIDIDRSDGIGSGNIYVLASVEGNTDPADVMFTKSTDGGNTWSQAKKINDDNSETNYQWFGTMSVAPNGRIDVIWLDTRDAQPGTDHSALYYSFSTDNGETWSDNEKLSEYFDPHVGYPNQMKMGDYFDMKSDNTGAHLAWAGTFNGEEDVYYSFIIPEISSTAYSGTEGKNIIVFPNPANGRVFIESEESLTFAEICSLTGPNLKSINFENTPSDFDISFLPDGLYLLKLRFINGTTKTVKLIKQ